MEQYLIDTNVISHYFSATISADKIIFMDSIFDAIPNLSVISQIELLCWFTDSQTTEKVKSFISESMVLNISQEVIEQCIKIRKGRKIKTPDAIIAATAIAYGYTLITDNEKDFANIRDLKLLGLR
jgi:predicted nucleic acid-binding protein